jgi:AraC-like DNA-binding protein
MNADHNAAQIGFWRVSQTDNLELLKVSASKYHYPRHIHPEYSIVLMLQGVETTTCRGITYKAYPGDLLLINAEEVHSSTSIGSSYWAIKISQKILSKVSSQMIGRNRKEPYFPELIVNDSTVFRLLLNLYLKMEQNISPLEGESEFFSTIGALLARQNKNNATFKSVRKEHRCIALARDYLKSHYAENVTLAELTSIVNMSPFYLLRVFHSEVGVPPHEFQTQVRIAQARKLLRKGMPISQVALATGFCDQSHLSRNFKRIVGLTPGQYLSQSKIVQYAAEQV